MSDTCPHVWSVSDWTRDHALGLWVHADPKCMKPSPLAHREPPKIRRRKPPTTRPTE